MKYKFKEPSHNLTYTHVLYISLLCHAVNVGFVTKIIVLYSRVFKVTIQNSRTIWQGCNVWDRV